MKFENTKVTGWENAVIGCRLPMCKDYEEAKTKSDSYGCGDIPCSDCSNGDKCNKSLYDYFIGENDMKLLKNLIKADDLEGKTGSPNSKFLRMIHVQVAITAPLYFYKELSTYKIATTYNSTSTMHKLASTPITIDCFEMDDYEDITFNYEKIFTDTTFWERLIIHLESLREKYNKTKDKRYWKELIRLLPESWLQTRMFDCNYETLRNIYCWRRNHKLTEWHTFCDWIETLPYAEELIINKKITDKTNKE